MLLHELPDFADLIEVTAREMAIDPSLVEKDYWIMQSLWGLQQQGFVFELKGGTSLSKGFALIERFSEDIDILIHPEDKALPMRPGQTKPAQVAARAAFFDRLAAGLSIPGIVSVERDHEFDDAYLRGAGIRLNYTQIRPLPAGVKAGVLLEAGFDQVSPNRPCSIGSWAWDKAEASGIADLTDNRAHGVPCYLPGYTLVEKLQTISTKYRRQRTTGAMPRNFLRHYYDVYCLLGCEEVRAFIGSEAYFEHKQRRFPKADEPNLARNPAFLLEDKGERARFAEAYAGTRALYYREQPSLDAVLGRIAENVTRL